MAKRRKKNPMKKHLINTDDLEYVIELALYSRYLKNADPLSLIISSKVGAGKTEIIKLYRNCRRVLFLSEATAYGIKSKYLDDIASGKVRHIVIGDLTRHSYSPYTKMKIYHHIATSDDISEIPPKKLWLPKKPVRVKPNKRFNLRLIELAMQMEGWEEVYGFRRLEQLQTLLMANALKNCRLRVTQ